MASIYLIKKMWKDPYENHINEAFGYEIVGYVSDEEEAKCICAAAGTMLPEGWPLEYVNMGKLVDGKIVRPLIPIKIYEKVDNL